MKYKIIYMDPPWSYRDKLRIKNKRGAITHYTVLNIKTLLSLDINRIADPAGCALCLWVTMPMLEEGLALIKTYGFLYKTVLFTWIKVDKSNKARIGLGHYTRGNAELCLLGIKGKMQVMSHSIKQVIMSSPGRHSEKPIEAAERIVQLFGDLPRIEVFARKKLDKWDATGLDYDGVDIRDFLKRSDNTEV